jgi:hypothetical protein
MKFGTILGGHYGAFMIEKLLNDRGEEGGTGMNGRVEGGEL